MIIAITILSVFVIGMCVTMTIAILYFLKLRKKLEETQKAELYKVSLYLQELGLAIKDIQDYLIEQKINQSTHLYNGNIGNA
jgi:hypothetical protein